MASIEQLLTSQAVIGVLQYLLHFNHEFQLVWILITLNRIRSLQLLLQENFVRVTISIV